MTCDTLEDQEIDVRSFYGLPGKGQTDQTIPLMTCPASEAANLNRETMIIITKRYL